MPTLNADLTLALDDQPHVIVPAEITYSYYAGRRPNDERAGYPDTGDEPEVTIIGIAATGFMRSPVAIVGPLRIALEPAAKAIILAKHQ